MSKSLILSIDEVAENQNNKHLTINEAISALESASNRRLPKSALTADVVLTEAEFTRYFLFDVSSQTTERFVILPELLAGLNSPQRFFAVRNSGAYNLTVKSSNTLVGGTTVVVTSGTTTFLHLAGYDVSSLGSIGSGIPLILSGYIPGLLPDAGAEIFAYAFTEASSFPDNFVGSKGRMGVTATADSACAVKKNGTTIGTLTYKADGNILFTTIASSNESFSIGDVLSVTAPAVQDATLASVSFSFKGLRV